MCRTFAGNPLRVGPAPLRLAAPRASSPRLGGARLRTGRRLRFPNVLPHPPTSEEASAVRRRLLLRLARSRPRTCALGARGGRAGVRRRRGGAGATQGWRRGGAVRARRARRGVARLRPSWAEGIAEAVPPRPRRPAAGCDGLTWERALSSGGMNDHRGAEVPLQPLGPADTQP